MSHDELRHALGRLAAEAPIELRRSEQVWARHRRNRRRHVAVTVGATGAAVLALLLAVPSTADRHGLVTQEPNVPTASASREGSVPAKSWPAPATPPSVSTSSPVAVTPSASVTRLPAAVPRWPVSVVAYAKPEHANPAQPVSVEVHPHAGDNGVESFEVDWGDGTVPTVTRVDHCGFVEGARRFYGSSRSGAAHTYGVVGRYEITVTVRFGGCGRPPQTATTTTSVLVDDALTGVHGPASTSVQLRRAELRSDPEPRKVALSLSVTDPDSYVAFAFLQWGDGTTSILRNGVPAWCKDSAPVLDPEFPAYVEHTYPSAGRYFAYAEVITATCDGGHGTGAGMQLPVTVS